MDTRIYCQFLQYLECITYIYFWVKYWISVHSARCHRFRIVDRIGRVVGNNYLLAVFLISTKVCTIMKFLENDIHQTLLFCAKKVIRGRGLALKFLFSVHLEFEKWKIIFYVVCTSIAEISNRYLTTFRMFSTFVFVWTSWWIRHE